MKSIWSNLLVLVLFSATIGVQFLVDHAQTGVGFEWAKVSGIRYISYLTILVTVLVPIFQNRGLVNKAQLTNSGLNSDLKILQGIKTKEPSFFFLMLCIILVAMAVTILFSYILSPFSQNFWSGSIFRRTGAWFWLTMLLITACWYIIGNFVEAFQISSIYGLIVALHLTLTTHFNLNFSAQAELRGNFGQPNFFAAVILTAILLAILQFGWSISTKRYKPPTNPRWKDFGIQIASSLSWSALIAYLSWGLWLTQSRGAFAILATFVLITAFTVFFKFIKLRYKIEILTVLLFVSYLSLSMFTYFTDEARRQSWTAAWQLFLMRPILGWGPDTFQSALRAEMLLPHRTLDLPHNQLLKLLYELGLWGFSLVAAAFTTVYINLKQNLRKNIDYKQIVYSIPILIFIYTGIFHTKSSYHYLELACFLGLFVSSIFQEKKFNS